MKKKILCALMAVVMLMSAAALSSCSGKSDYPATVGGVTIKDEPEGIVILNKNHADIISAIGYDIKMVGRSDDITTEGLQVVPSVGSAQDPDVDKIEKLDADIVIGDSTLNPDTAKELGEKGVDVITFEYVNTPKQIKSLYKKLGVVLGGNITGKTKAKEAFDKLRGTLRDVKNAIEASNLVHTVCYLYTDNGVLKTFNKDTWGSTLLGYTGTMNVFKNSDTNVVDVAQLGLSNPDFIFCDSEETVTYLKQSEKLGKLDALKSRTFITPYSDITMQGYTALDTLETMLRSMYPAEFASSEEEASEQ